MTGEHNIDVNIVIMIAWLYHKVMEAVMPNHYYVSVKGGHSDSLQHLKWWSGSHCDDSSISMKAMHSSQSNP